MKKRVEYIQVNGKDKVPVEDKTMQECDIV